MCYLHLVWGRATQCTQGQCTPGVQKEAWRSRSPWHKQAVTTGQEQRCSKERRLWSLLWLSDDWNSHPQGTGISPVMSRSQQRTAWCQSEQELFSVLHYCLSSREELGMGGQAWLVEPSRTQAFDPKHSSNKTAGFVSYQPLTQQMHCVKRPLARWIHKVSMPVPSLHCRPASICSQIAVRVFLNSATFLRR